MSPGTNQTTQQVVAATIQAMIAAQKQVEDLCIHYVKQAQTDASAGRYELALDQVRGALDLLDSYDTDQVSGIQLSLAKQALIDHSPDEATHHLEDALLIP